MEPSSQVRHPLLPIERVAVRRLHRCRPVRLHIRHHPALLTSGGVHHS